MTPELLGSVYPDELEEHADEIARQGVVVVTLDPFAHLQASGPLAEADSERAMARMGEMDFARVKQDFCGVLAALKEDAQCNGRVVGLGICV